MGRSQKTAGNASRTCTVLAFRASETVNNRLHFDGIFRYAREHGWHVQAFEYHRNETDPLCWRDPDSGSSTCLNELLDFWKPSGCIVDVGSVERPLPRQPFGKIPVAYLDWNSDTLPPMSVGIACDNRRVSEIAARELFGLGFGNFAFVPALGGYPWSDARGREFSRLAGLNRCALHVFPGGAGENESKTGWRDRMRSWLVALPKPCGIFAAHDFIGKNVIEVCGTCGIGVPDEVAVVGVDDDPQICENTVPTMTSIRQDYESGGYSVCEALARMIANRRTRPQLLKYGVLCIARRASSFKCADRRVLKAIEFIRRHACERIGLDDVAREMGVSRRLATSLFRRVTGLSILDRIHEERLNRVKQLLSNPRQDVKSLPDFTGYKSLVDLRRVFKARTGVSMGEFRRNSL